MEVHPVFLWTKTSAKHDHYTLAKPAACHRLPAG